MPLKSKAQVAKWGALVKEGKIKQSTFDEAMKTTPKRLPERVTPKKATKIKSVDDIKKYIKNTKIT